MMCVSDEGAHLSLSFCIHRVKRTVVEGTSAAAALKKPVAPKGALDSVLDALKAPESISTVAKSSLDWDSFKQDQGLEDELAQVTKDG